MKLLVIGIDAVEPRTLFNNIDKFPNIKKLVENGTSKDYDCYVDGYGSHDNWISLYTGVPPYEHKIIKGRHKETNEYPNIQHFEKFTPFWEILNKNGYSTGVWKGFCTTPPVDLNGYMISGEPHYDQKSPHQNYMKWEPFVTDKVQEKFNFEKLDFPEIVYPKNCEELGYSWSELQNEPNKVDEIVLDDYFKESIEMFEGILEYNFTQIKKAYEISPVDLFWFYDSTYDYVSHFQMHSKSQDVLIELLKRIDVFLGKMMDLMNPDNVIFLSDHGQESWKDLFGEASNETIRKAFGLANVSIISDKNIFIEGKTPGFLSGLHSLKGTIVFSGQDFIKTDIKDMKNLDFYPTLMELFDIGIPSEKEGYVQKIFAKENYKNESRLYPEKVLKEEVLIIQTTEVPIFNKVINEFYNRNRFNEIVILCKPEYNEIYNLNPRVKKVVNTHDGWTKTIVIPFIDVRNNEMEFLKFEAKDFKFNSSVKI